MKRIEFFSCVFMSINVPFSSLFSRLLDSSPRIQSSRAQDTRYNAVQFIFSFLWFFFRSHFLILTHISVSSDFRVFFCALDSFRRFALAFIGLPLYTICSISVFSVQFTSSSSCAAKYVPLYLFRSSISISMLFLPSEVSSWVMWKCYDNLFYYVGVIWSTQKSQKQVSDFRFLLLPFPPPLAAAALILDFGLSMFYSMPIVRPLHTVQRIANVIAMTSPYRRSNSIFFSLFIFILLVVDGNGCNY